MQANQNNAAVQLDLVGALQQLLNQNQAPAGQQQVQQAMTAVQLQALIQVLGQLQKMNEKKEDKPLTIGSFFKDFVVSPMSDVTKLAGHYLAVGATLYTIAALLIAIGAETFSGGIDAADVVALAARLPVKLLWGFVKAILDDQSNESLEDGAATALFKFLTSPVYNWS